MKRIDSGYRFPNGIAVQYDKKGQKPQNLIVAETPAKTLWSIPFVAEKNGVVDVSRKKIFGRCPGEHTYNNKIFLQPLTLKFLTEMDNICLYYKLITVISIATMSADC